MVDRLDCTFLFGCAPYYFQTTIAKLETPSFHSLPLLSDRTMPFQSHNNRQLMGEQSTERILKTIKWINIITSVSIIVFSVTGVIYLGITAILGAKFFMVFSPIFMTFFGVLLLATECKLDFVLRRVGFLRSLIGRGVFNIYLASEVFYFFSCGTGDGVLGWVFGVALFGLGIVYLVLHFCGGSEYREQLKRRLEL